MAEVTPVAATVQRNTLLRFWQTFHVFRFTFERRSVAAWYLYGIIALLVVTVSALFLDNSFAVGDHESLLTYYHNMGLAPFFRTNLGSFYETWWVPWWVVILPLPSYFAYRWISRLPQTLQQLFLHVRLPNAKVSAQSVYLGELQRFQRLLLHRGRYLLSVLTSTLGIVACARALGLGETIANLHNPAYAHDGLLIQLGLTIGLMMITFYGSYIVGIIIWSTYQTTAFIIHLVRRYPLIVDADHPDHSGGLRFLGYLFFEITLPILLFYVLFSLDFLSFFREDVDIQPQTIAAIDGLGLLFTVIVFCVPVWFIHRNMRRVAREENAPPTTEDEAALIALQEEHLATLNEGNTERVRALREQIAAVAARVKQESILPSWPFDRTLLFRLLSPQIAAVALLAFNLFSGGPPTTSTIIQRLQRVQFNVPPADASDEAQFRFFVGGSTPIPFHDSRSNSYKQLKCGTGEIFPDGLPLAMRAIATSALNSVRAACEDGGLHIQPTSDMAPVLFEMVNPNKATFHADGNFMSSLDVSFASGDACAGLLVRLRYAFSICGDGAWYFDEFSDQTFDDTTTIAFDDVFTLGHGQYHSLVSPQSAQPKITVLTVGSQILARIGNDTIGQFSDNSGANYQNEQSDVGTLLATKIILNSDPATIASTTQATVSTLLPPEAGKGVILLDFAVSPRQ